MSLRGLLTKLRSVGGRALGTAATLHPSLAPLALAARAVAPAARRPPPRLIAGPAPRALPPPPPTVAQAGEQLAHSLISAAFQRPSL